MPRQPRNGGRKHLKSRPPSWYIVTFTHGHKKGRVKCPSQITIFSHIGDVWFYPSIVSKSAQLSYYQQFQPTNRNSNRRHLVFTPIVGYLHSQQYGLSMSHNKKLQSLPAILQPIENESVRKLQSLPAISSEPWQTTPNHLFHRINYTSLQMLSEISDPLKRAFYEHELIQGCWSTRQLDRQISSLYYERSALSKDKDALRRHMQQGAEPLTPNLVLRDPMTLEFLGIPDPEELGEDVIVKDGE